MGQLIALSGVPDLLAITKALLNIADNIYSAHMNFFGPVKHDAPSRYYNITVRSLGQYA